jgi:hypothetical protein
MVCNTTHLRHLDFSQLKESRLEYADQEQISLERVDLAMSALIDYGLHPGMLIRYLKDEYSSKSQDVKIVLTEVKPYVKKKGLKHIECILTQGCPSQLIFEEESANKLAVI